MTTIAYIIIGHLLLSAHKREFRFYQARKTNKSKVSFHIINFEDPCWTKYPQHATMNHSENVIAPSSGGRLTLLFISVHGRHSFKQGLSMFVFYFVRHLNNHFKENITNSIYKLILISRSAILIYCTVNPFIRFERFRKILYQNEKVIKENSLTASLEIYRLNLTSQ